MFNVRMTTLPTNHVKSSLPYIPVLVTILAPADKSSLPNITDLYDEF